MPLLDKVKSLFRQNSGGKTVAPVNDVKLGVIIGLIIAALSLSGILEKYELVLLDEMFRIRGEQKVKDNIVIIEIEDQSLKMLGKWPWPRMHHADFLKMLSLARPKAVAFDILFPEADLEGDEALAMVAKEMGSVSFAAYFTLEKEPNTTPLDNITLQKMPSLVYTIKSSDRFLHASSITPPVTTLANTAKRILITNVPQDPDGSTRRVPLVIEFNGALYPTFSLQLACDCLGADIKDIKIQPHAIILPLKEGAISIPIDKFGQMLLNYNGPIDVFQQHSYLQIIQDYNRVMKGEESERIKRLSDKILFIGHAATGTIDSRIMPFSNVYPAVGVHATALSNILNRNPITPASLALNIFTVLFLGIFLGAFLKKGRKAVTNLSIMAAMFAAYGVLCYALFAFFNFWLNAFAPLLVITITYVGATVNQYSAIRYEKKIMENELSIAWTIQQSFLPKNYPAVSFLDFAARCSPTKHIGGDLYDFVTLREDKIGILIGDVSGKGVPAALYMARVISEFRAISHLHTDPASTLKELNDLVSSEGMEKSFITMQYIIVDLKSKRVLFSNGGHNTVLHFSKNSRKIEEIDTAGGMPIGVMEGVSFDNKEILVEKGDMLFLYTDGISESMNKNHKEFGLSRVKNILLGNCELKAQEVMQKVLDEIAKFSKGAPQHDDMTLIVIKAV